MRELVAKLDERVVLGFVAVLRAALLARGRRHHLHHASGRTLVVPAGRSIPEAVRAAGISHASVCGGRGRRTTCRVRVGRGLEALPEPREVERHALARIKADPNVRLACRTHPTSALSVSPCQSVDPGQGVARGGSRAGRRLRPRGGGGDHVHRPAGLDQVLFGCTLVVSTAVTTAAGVDLSAHPLREAELKGRGESVPVHAIDDPGEIREVIMSMEETP